MQFQAIDVETLKPNQKYKINWQGNEYTATFYQHFEHGCVDFIKVNQDGFRFPYIRFHSFFNLTVYEPIFHTAQQTMERRAINLIVQRVLNDPFFFW
jgi:hypothetical protein